MTDSATRQRSPLAVAVGVLLVFGAALFVLPDLVELDRSVPFTQLVAVRRVLVVLLLGFAALVAVYPPWRLTAAGLAVVALVGVGLLAPRAVADDAPPPQPGETVLTVLTLNVDDGSTDADTVAAVLERERPALVTLPEAGPSDVDDLQEALDGLGYRVQAAPDDRTDDFDTVSVALAPSLADAEVSTGQRGDFPAIEVTGGALGSLRFVAYHANAPVPNRMDLWLADLPVLQRWCGAQQPTVIAGDLNATLDHSLLRSSIAGCADAAEQLGKGLVGTFPVSRPRWIGVQIDHVLVTGGVRPLRVEILDVPGSNHRAVLAEVAVPPT